MKLKALISNVKICADISILTQKSEDPEAYEQAFFCRPDGAATPDDFPGKLLKLNVAQIQADYEKGSGVYLSIFCDP